MASRSLGDLRNHLFETLEGLKNKETPMDIDRAQAITNVSAQIINAAKVELQFLNTIGQALSPESSVDPKGTSKFFEEPKKTLDTGKRLGGGK